MRLGSETGHREGLKTEVGVWETKGGEEVEWTEESEHGKDGVRKKGFREVGEKKG